MDLPDDIVIPKNGVYVTKTLIEGKLFNSITNIGIQPSFANSKPSLETHIFDFNKECYDKVARIYFFSFLREEKKFNDIEALKDQIEKDILKAKGYTYLKELSIPLETYIKMLKIPHSKNIITDQEETILTGLDSSSLAYVLSRHSESLPPFSLIISKNMSTTSALLSDLRFFLSSMELKKKKTNGMLFSGWDLSPYSKLSSSVGNRVQRLSCLKKIQELSKDSSKENLIIISPIAALAQGTIAPENTGTT